MAHTVKLKQKQNMRTKILLTAAAALAAGVVASNAQVYSANIVGYYNTTLTGAGGFTLVGNQLVNGASNDVATLLATMPNKTVVQTWNGTSFASTQKGGTGWTPSDPQIAVGQGFFIQTPTASGPLTNTFVGSVLPNVGTSVTNVYAAASFNLVASTIPYAGLVSDTSNINLGTLPNKTVIQTWNGASFDSTQKGGTGWTPTTPNIAVGQGFFLVAPTATSATWIQTLPAN